VISSLPCPSGVRTMTSSTRAPSSPMTLSTTRPRPCCAFALEPQVAGELGHPRGRQRSATWSNLCTPMASSCPAPGRVTSGAGFRPPRTEPSTLRSAGRRSRSWKTWRRQYALIGMRTRSTTGVCVIPRQAANGPTSVRRPSRTDSSPPLRGPPLNIKCHSGHPLNEAADRLANAAALS
jgi:hypothetical protein